MNVVFFAKDSAGKNEKHNLFHRSRSSNPHARPPPAIAAQDLAPLYEARSVGQEPIRDKQNRIFYIVDLKDGTDAAFADKRDAKKPKKYAERHTEKTQNMFDGLESEFGAEVLDGTSWVGLSFFAYLNNGQLNKLRSDPRVSTVTEVVELEFSQTAPSYPLGVNTPPPIAGAPGPALNGLFSPQQVVP